jgi:Tol biopolymer transport system component
MLHRPDAGRQQRGPVPQPMVRAQLEKILASETFSRSERLSRFLRFIVEETLDGRAAGIKERVLALELYGRSTDFDAAMDPIVRVDARRLRDKLREYYAQFPDAPVAIGLPRGGYIPSFETNPGASPPAAATKLEAAPTHVPRTPPPGWVLPAIAVAGIALFAAAVWWAYVRGSRDVPPRLVPLTSLPGDERWPALSPEGNFLAFTCSTASDLDAADICVKAVGSDVFRPVLRTPEAEYRPAWSPDGREIAFSRAAHGKELGIFIVPRAGGSERRVSQTGTAVAWIPNGRSILIRDRLDSEPGPSAIFEVDVDSLSRRRLTEPRIGAGDWSFDVSPDGATIALIRYQRPGLADLYVMPITGGEPRRLTNWNSVLSGPAWTPDGKEIVYAVNDRLWRISASAAQPDHGSPISGIPMPAGHVSISRPRSGQTARLVFHTPQQQVTLRKIALDATDPGGAFQRVLTVAPSTRKDMPGHFSPDGSKLAFTSTRGSTDYELWVADSDGSHPRQLTTLGGNGLMLAHAWSPDGGRILFETAVDGNTDLFVIPAAGGKPVRLTTTPAIEALADWSSDGRWIYYTRVVSGLDATIWRIPSEGGAPEQITTEVGSEPHPSPDGRHIYYVDRPPLDTTIAARLMRIPAAGGSSEVIRERVFPLYWSRGDKGIYFLAEEGQSHSIYLYRFADQKIARVGGLPFRPTVRPQGRGRLTVSLDGRWAVINATDRWEGDLMLWDGFK